MACRLHLKGRRSARQVCSNQTDHPQVEGACSAVLAIVTSVLTLGGIAVGLSLVLVLVNRKLHVEEDPRLDIVEEMLPGNNCGACGLPGCRAFSEAAVGGETAPGKCTVSTDEGRARIAQFLGIDVGAQEKVVARLACAGGANVSRNRADYQGLGTCRGAALVGGGGKSCAWGCLGLSDCADVCDFDAIYMNEHSLPVVIEDACTACGDCVEVCPKGVDPMGRIMTLRDQAMAAGYTKSYGARHATILTQMVEHSGRVDELRLPVKTKGIFNIPEMLKLIPIGVRAQFSGKVPPIIHRKNPGQENVRRIFKKVESKK